MQIQLGTRNFSKMSGLDYWKLYWDYYINKLKDADNIYIRVEGSRLVLLDLIAEIEEHGLVNQDNIGFFVSKLSMLDKRDVAFNGLCHPILVSLLPSLKVKEKCETCLLLCRKALEILSTGKYFDGLVDGLCKEVESVTLPDYEQRLKICKLTGWVIAEYIAEGFTLDDIQKLPENINDARSCFEQLKGGFYEEPKEALYIVRLLGLKGQVNDMIGDINIYSPKVKRYTPENSISRIEDFSMEDRDYVCAAIPVLYRSAGQAKKSALSKMDEIADLLTLSYNTQTPIEVATNHHSVVIDGQEIGSSFSARGNDPEWAEKDKFMKYLDSLDLNSISGDGIKFVSEKQLVLSTGNLVLNRRLRNAARWYTKAQVSKRDEDILLNSWFAIEGLLKLDESTKKEVTGKDKSSTISVIQEFVASIMGLSYFRNYLNSTYFNMVYVTTQWKNYYGLDEDVCLKARLNLKVGDRMQSGDFLRNIDLVMSNLDNIIVADELKELKEFYAGEDGLKTLVKQIREDMLMIYRLRNMIVHNAVVSCVNLPFYAREAKAFAMNVIRYVINKSSQYSDIKDIVLDASLDYQVFMNRYPHELELLQNK